MNVSFYSSYDMEIILKSFFAENVRVLSYA